MGGQQGGGGGGGGGGGEMMVASLSLWSSRLEPAGSLYVAKRDEIVLACLLRPEEREREREETN